MIKFLLQHAVALDGREESHMHDVAFCNPGAASSNNEELLKRSDLAEQIIRQAQVAPRTTFN